MNAKEMFEELGYKKTENDAKIIYSKRRYKITFFKLFDEFCHENGGCLNVEEFKAIHQQLIELGWIS